MQPFYQPCLFSHQCLYLALAVLDCAYFRDMLIFEPMLIFARVRYVNYIAFHWLLNGPNSKITKLVINQRKADDCQLMLWNTIGRWAEHKTLRVILCSTVHVSLEQKLTANNSLMLHKYKIITVYRLQIILRSLL